MDLPVRPPVEPMLSRAADRVPAQPDGEPAWLYEPKWDGFRCLLFRDGDEVVLGSRGGKPLTRYFPEVVAGALAELPARCVVDGELVVPGRDDGAGGDRLDWELLSQRVHPAASRVETLSREQPALFVAFDLLAVGDEDLTGEPTVRRRKRLARELSGSGPVVRVTRATLAEDVAARWFALFEGAGLDGVVAKPLDAPYAPGQRVMTKVKHRRTAECVVVGYREHRSLPGVGSVLLGLRVGEEVRGVGAVTAFTTARRAELLAELSALRLGEDVRTTGEPNRWNARRDTSWVPVRQELVWEVEYDQLEGSRFRHSPRFLRARPDRDPAGCALDQLDVPARYSLADVLTGAGAR
ncbi:ATP-dependent DNA ligase [Kineococcus terrestris]|uniref:ATP-dependent DNA ligase n=1 Tax=Kineococcus terrestris TaxID=2044856 RepID=UPI0034DABB41